MMIGGPDWAVQRLDPIFKTLAPGIGDIPRTPGRDKSATGTSESGYLHCGPSGAGHFVKMVHNGIEYGLMAAYAEGLGILRAANVGKKPHMVDAETTPLRDPEHYQYDLNLPDIAEVWRRGSVIASWLLDLTATALLEDPALAKFAGRVSDSGEGRWTIAAAIDEAVPAPVLTTALYERFSSRGEADFQNKTAFGDALRIRRALGKARRQQNGGGMSELRSDALVFFGATGDLAYKKIFPALQAMLKRGHLDVPVIGVAKAGWTLEQLKARARDSLEKHGGLDAAAFEKLSGLLRYVDGDYGDRATFDAVRKQLGSAQRPAHYLAIPPALFATVVEQLTNAGCTHGARVIVEKPFGHDLVSAHELNKILLAKFDEDHIFRIDHYLGKRPVHNMVFFRFANAFLESFWNRQVVEQRADHHGGGFRRPRPRRILRSDRHHSRRDPKPPVPGAGQSGDGATGAIRTASRCATKRSRC